MAFLPQMCYTVANHTEEASEMSEMKNVLLLGDSRRQGYEPYVRTILEGRAGVYGPNENGRWAGYTLNSLRFWLDQFPVPQIVHWNCGLWDLGDATVNHRF